MAKSGTPRHSKPVRKPVTIEHDPAPKQKTDDTVNPKPHTHEAEPVGDFTKTPASRPTTVKAEVPKPSAAKPMSSPSQSDTIKPDTLKDTGSVSQSHMQAEPKPQSQTSAKMSEPTAVKNTRNTGSTLIAGIAGGMIALAGAAALQWGNVIPSPGARVTAEQLAHLEQEVSTLKIAPVTATLNQAGQQKLDQAESLAQATATKLDELDNSTTEKLNNLQNKVDNLPIAGSAIVDADIEALTAKIAALETQLATAASKANEAVANASTDQNSITTLQDQFTALQEKVSETSRQPDMAALIAANSLKNAIDRGGSYVAELETFTSLHPADPAAEMLEQHSITGIPTIADFNAWFNPVADKIVATANKPAPDAGLWEQLMASAKGLISVRPVGDVSGTGVGPTTARMESALHSGDLERAINEWEQLPDDAKAVSQEFADQMKLRRDADQLLTRLMTQSLQPKADDATPQAAQ
ncbi:COG4223 family protein [Paenochrobactrum sp. BZR 588]|uniref:COG4223 family protein n=1 Tax=unclassified Paenochrobactrum TaxID=2639760 RepID=UPI0038533503